MASWILIIYSCFLKLGYNINNIRMFMWRLRKIDIMPTVRQNLFLLRNISRVGIPKSTVIVIIFRVFMWPPSFRNAGTRRIIYLKCFEIVSKKIQDNIIKALWTMELIFRLLILKWNPRLEKSLCHVWKIMNMRCYSLQIDDDALFKNKSKRFAFVLIPLKSILNFEVVILSLQQLEYGMDCTDYHVYYIWWNMILWSP